MQRIGPQMMLVSVSFSSPLIPNFARSASLASSSALMLTKKPDA